MKVVCLNNFSVRGVNFIKNNIYIYSKVSLGEYKIENVIFDYYELFDNFELLKRRRSRILSYICDKL